MIIKIRPSIIIGELVLGTALVYAIINGSIEAVLGIAGIIGTTMSKLVESEEKS